ncbi:Salutaridinol 7-O-acetyltransferase [Morella rubra]|uniref:Salutaridinol 7-O-acetyltransferase n=1 Tax=Morella rubra TaxID=262757 RepID=A0A6A1ULR2_9ROSI|nr:Salutaridinol 7-O-acetyltransferase [Morella rubra]KAB1201185.1 Salutaridinol 7-O-acetyltransferase [Morella rubra]KAB1201192.1 Salutaridinol 7-O-acetyltransferase [Morella rubra]
MEITKVDVEILSKYTVKPSSATPDHLRHYTLSFIDQITPAIFMPFVLYYPRDASGNDLNNEERHERLKKSLSEALTRFYPLAGRVKDNSHVDCNDDGVDYVVAKATCRLSEFLEDPNPAEISKFLPCELDEVNELPLAVQVTSFTCGGIVIGLAFAHKVSDASSFILFLNSWAAIARGNSDIAIPRFESASIFPPVTLPSHTPPRGTEKDNIVVKRFVFDAAAIATLRDKYNTENTSIKNQRATRVEALTAFIWSRFLASTKPAPNMLYSLSYIGNLRKRLDPPLSDEYFGNMSLPTGFAISRDNEDVFQGIIIPGRDAISKIDMNYVKGFQENGGHSNFVSQNRERFMKGEVVGLAITSLCRFPIYEADFGWGKPVWVSSSKMLYRNLIGFFDTKSGNGIEVWVNLGMDDMAKFEEDKELLAYVSSATVSQN